MDLVSHPGISMAVVDKGEVVWSRVMGTANGKTGRPVAANATFEAASMSKPIFAYVVMKLVDEKLLDLDRPLTQYCRPDWLADDPSIDLVTVRRSEEHTSELQSHSDLVCRLLLEKKKTRQHSLVREAIQSHHGVFPHIKIHVTNNKPDHDFSFIANECILRDLKSYTILSCTLDFI